MAVVICAIASAGYLARAEEKPPPRAPRAPEKSVRPGLNDTFLSNDLDVDRFVKIFEGESREIYVQRRAIVRALELTPGMPVADIGAGTGLFMAPLAKAVGSAGKVFEVDISPVFVKHLRARARDENLGSVSVVLDRARSVELPDASIDQSGFELEKEIPIEGLKENYMLRFRRL